MELTGLQRGWNNASKTSQDTNLDDDSKGLLLDEEKALGSARSRRLAAPHQQQQQQLPIVTNNPLRSEMSMTRFTETVKDLSLLADDYERGVSDLQKLFEAGKIDEETCKMYKRKLQFDYERANYLCTRLKAPQAAGFGVNTGTNNLDGLNTKILTEKGVLQPNPDEQIKPKAKPSLTDNPVVGMMVSSVFESGINAMLQHLNLKKFRTAKNLFKRKLALIGLAFNGTLFALFIYLFVMNYTNLHVKQKFVAVDASSGDCQSVPRPYTLPLITADYYGNWQGQYAFDANRNYYQFNLYALALTDTTYREFMKTMGTAVNAVGDKSASNELAINLLYWHAWFYDEQVLSPDGITFTQTISFAANVIDILNTETIEGTVWDEADNCPNSYSYKTYDSTSGVAAMQFPMDKFRATSACFNAIDEGFLGYDREIDGDRFTVELDMTTMFSALSVAYDVNGDNTLIRYQFIDNVMEKFMFNGNWYSIGRFYDIQNPTMSPMHCVGPINHEKGDFSAFNCMVPVGGTFGIPLFRHRGVDPDFPVECDCSTTGTNDYCDVFDFITGVMVWGANDAVMSKYDPRLRPYMPALEFFYLPPPVTTKEANSLVYPILFGGLYTGNNTASKDLFKNTTWRHKQLAFSDTPNYGSASIIGFRFNSEYDKSISADNTQLEVRRRLTCNQLKHNATQRNLPHSAFTSIYTSSLFLERCVL